MITPGQVRLRCGSAGTAPLYLAVSDGVLTGSWHLPALRHHVRLDRLLDHVVARTLIRRPRYSRDTLFDGVVMVTERSVVTVTRAGLSVAYPDPATHVLADREVRAGRDVVAAFEELLDASVRRAVSDRHRVGVELSGGVDSANVAATAVRNGLSATSFGLVLDGHPDQSERRATLVSWLGLVDIPIRAADHPPFASHGVRGLGVPHDPCAAFYREAFDALCRDAAGRVDLMLTGLGGDELLALRQPPRAESMAGQPVDLPPWLGARTRSAVPDVDADLAPVPVLPIPTLMSFALHNPAYLDVGIWPVSPLATPALVRFCEQLPPDWRQDKAILRERLSRIGLPRRVSHPERPESFSGLMQLGLRRHGLKLVRRMLDESVLVDTGFVDQRRLAEAYRMACVSSEVPSLLCDTIGLEVGLRSLLGRPFRGGGGEGG